MRSIQGLLGLVLPLLAIAAKSKTPTSAYAKYHSKAVSSPPLQLDDQSFSALTSAPREHGLVVCLTALAAQYGCQICNAFDPEWTVLGKSWMKSSKEAENRLIFATLDFSDGRQSFQQLQLETAPVLMYYPPTTGPHASASSAPVKFEFGVSQPSAESVQTWLSRQLPPTISIPPVRRPINYIKIASITTIVLGLITLVSVAWPYVLPIIQSRNLWAALSIIAILLFTSGHMFNHIRTPPYISGNGQGKITYFAGGFQNQLGIESQIIAGLYGVLAFATISLAVKVPRIQDRKMQQTAVFVWLGVMYGTYAFLISIFKIKNGGYPYSLPPF